MIPNLFIIGAPKCGTSALSHYLSEHENVFFSNPKEPFFLSTDYPKLKQQHFLRTQDDYLRLFSAANPSIHRIVGEGSTTYLASNVAVANALKLNPSAKFIVLLRDPVEVVHGFHMEQVFSRNEDESDFKRAWRLQETRRSGDRIPKTCRAKQFLQYREMAMFSKQVQRFFDLVPVDQRLLLFQADMRKDTLAIYKQVLDFLELSYDGRTYFGTVNISHTHRYEWIANLVLVPPPMLRPMVWTFRNYARRRKPRVIEALKRWLKVRSTREVLPEAFVEELRDEFRADLHQLKDMIGRPLTQWQ